MFQSENDDLIPRCAPKPIASDVKATECRPSVPEISIVFSQKPSENLSCSPSNIITSYSVWKNKCIPSDPYPQDAVSLYNELSLTSKRSNVYPLRTGESATSSINNTMEYVPLNKPQYLDRAGKNKISSNFIPRCVLDNSKQKQYQASSLKPLEENSPLVSVGTQTDVFLIDDNLCDKKTLATKEDIAEIKSLILKMETEQRHLLETLQNLVKEKLYSEKNKPKSRDIGVQNVLFNEGISTEEPLNIQNNLKERALTDYQLSKVQIACTDEIPEITKTATDRSIVMNELAEKYLPIAKLTDMLEEFPKGKKVKNLCELPSKTTDNLDKNATDLSTASYKYLRKYRLIPEENNNLSKNNDFHRLKSDNKLENLLDLEIIRCKPKFI
ncbi:uncharacterized protein LOC129950974 [Eupeodes corollae]|uniref:uncharacterized protein LOC129950974 n=1 Tax=Eupeodes corollae TaxID=290404 RepID=UPI00249343F3|nr:uncharacterized protein LOC129950974 [Eupeodes corollae]